MRMDSHIGSNLRGSVGGLTYTRTRTQAIVCRTRIAPVNSESENRSSIRGAMAECATIWLSLSTADRLAWQAYAATVTYTGPLGTYQLTGREMFNACYGLGLYARTRGISAVVEDPDAPLIPGRFNVSAPTAVPPSGPGTGVGISLNNPTTEDAAFLIQRSIAYNPTRLQYKGPWLPSVYTGTVVPAATGTITNFLSLVDGMAYFFRVRAIAADGPSRISNEWFIRGIAEIVAP